MLRFPLRSLHLIFQPPANRRIGETHHLPPCSSPVSAVTRVTVKALHGVIHQQPKEFRRRNFLPRFWRSLCLFHLGQQLNLSSLRQECKVAAVKQSVALIKGGDSATIGLPQIL